MAILAADDLAERIACTVVGANLPLGAQIFEPEIADVLPPRIHVVFFGNEIAIGDADVVAGVAKRARTQECDFVRVITGHVKIVFDGDWMQEWSHF